MWETSCNDVYIHKCHTVSCKGVKKKYDKVWLYWSFSKFLKNKLPFFNGGIFFITEFYPQWADILVWCLCFVSVHTSETHSSVDISFFLHPPQQSLHAFHHSSLTPHRSFTQHFLTIPHKSCQSKVQWNSSNSVTMMWIMTTNWGIYLDICSEDHFDLQNNNNALVLGAPTWYNLILFGPAYWWWLCGVAGCWFLAGDSTPGSGFGCILPTCSPPAAGSVFYPLQPCRLQEPSGYPAPWSRRRLLWTENWERRGKGKGVGVEWQC